MFCNNCQHEIKPMKMFGVWVPSSVAEEIKQFSARENLTISRALRELIADALQRQAAARSNAALATEA